MQIGLPGRYWEWQIGGGGVNRAYVPRLHGRRPRDVEIGSGRSGVGRGSLPSIDFAGGLDGGTVREWRDLRA
jgi:hypothetical protein